ncbi:class I SAM-dependent DNA methyltransferase [Bacillus solimangrovi]|uniref:Methyltransferase n=1 Tax=Bacillus solimangrovi TaxID=1305675 RepID=A0A1E5LHX7_9BACI|nr:class I SAM-dependent methyltransferase [Bacillus solimangrovi]OEH93677.1 methyltransferase [Bacillus solimangrovi]
MAYQAFAYLYDKLMQDAPYDDWLKLTRRMADQYGISGNRLLDLACGTGELSIRLSKQGWNVSGVDLSDDMLAVAQEKAVHEKQIIDFFKQDMRQLTGFNPFDLIVIYCDSLNYLEAEEDVKRAFINIHSFLKEDGLFMFDVHSTYKIRELFIGQTYASNDDDLSFIWQCYEGETLLTVEHDLTFFVREGNNYKRFDETHIQRTFEEDVYERLLNETGFQLEGKLYDFQNNYSDNAERVIFIAKKKI